MSKKIGQTFGSSPRCVGCLILICVCVFSVSYDAIAREGRHLGAGAKIEIPSGSLSDRLSDGDYQKRMEAYDGITQHRASIIRELVAMIDRKPTKEEIDVDSRNPSARLLAVRAVGALRAQEGTAALITNIRMLDRAHHPLNPDEKVGLEQSYPAVKSLIQVGNPAVPLLLEFVKMRRLESTERQLAVVAIVRILGRPAAELTINSELKVGRERGENQAGVFGLERAREMLNDPAIRTNLLIP